MADDPTNSGLSGAHTPAVSGEIAVDPERAAKVGTTKATAEAAMAGLAERLAGGDEADQPELLLADPDEEFVLFKGPVRHVANIRDAAKRGRGRPAGSKNRASNDLASYLLSMGYRDPALNLADLANADPLALALELAGLEPREDVTATEYLAAAIQAGLLKRDQALAVINDAQGLVLKANAELLPYFHSKRPTEIKMDKRVLGVMLLGDMATERADDDKPLDLTRVDAP
ncbi:hypothetical protein [Shinella kummerowiae]|uniref:hypothetical protein n=1 Tax=Shinella kummerowiae TaxID=417745 RepID=UPI0021B6B5AD|nr:hypothetical protein [Shinella kummerowiae]MCT7662336.1 hypothetical protein [Shinella kummerowiae]